MLDRRWLLSVALAGLLTACGGVPTPAGTGTTVPLPEGYPAFGGGTQEAYPGANVTTVVSAAEPPAEAPATAPGTASLAGVMTIRGTTNAIASTVFYITPGQGPDQTFPPDYISDPDKARGDLEGATDESGRFSLTNIPPGKYFFFVWGPYGWREIEAGADDQKPILLELEADERLVLGTVIATYP